MSQNSQSRSTRGTRGVSSTPTTRHSTHYENNFCTPLPRFSTAPTIRCLSFGPHRKEKWGKSYDWCSFCDAAQDMMMKRKNKNWPNLESKTYRCRAKHTSLARPSLKVQEQWCPSKALSPMKSWARLFSASSSRTRLCKRFISASERCSR